MDQLNGKLILLLGVAGECQRFALEAADEYQIQICLVENQTDHFAKNLVKHFVVYDTTDHSRDKEHALNIKSILESRGIEVDGCLTLKEDNVVLTSMLCTHLGLICAAKEAASIAKSKYLTHKILSNIPDLSCYAAPSHLVKNQAEIESVASKINFPALVKMEYGSGSVGVHLVNDIDDCYHFMEHVNSIANDVKAIDDHRKYGLFHGSSMVMMNYIDGTEHDVDLVMFDGKLLGAFINDNGPTQEPCFHETSAVMPSRLNSEKQNQIINAAYQCCLGVGLQNGVFSPEFKMTKNGPKLLEINARMHAWNTREWNRRVYGVDILKCAYLISCGIEPQLGSPSARTNIIGVHIMQSDNLLKLLKNGLLDNVHILQRDDHVYYLQIQKTDPLPTEMNPKATFGHLSIENKDVEVAKHQLLAITKYLGIWTDEYPVDYFMKFLFRGE